MPGLAFDALDRHVIGGRADTVVLTTSNRRHTFAELLDASASVAGGLRMLGLDEGDGLHLGQIDRWRQVVTVLACARAGIFTRDEAPVSVTGEPVVVRLDTGEESWDTVLKVGRGDPVAAPSHDAVALAAHMLQRHEDVFTPLLQGRALEP